MPMLVRTSKVSAKPPRAGAIMGHAYGAEDEDDEGV